MLVLAEKSSAHSSISNDESIQKMKDDTFQIKNYEKYLWLENMQEKGKIHFHKFRKIIWSKKMERNRREGFKAL